MKTPRRDIALAVVSQLHDGVESRKIVAGLAHYLVQERRVRELDAIMREVSAVRATRYGVVEASVATAVPLTEDLAHEVRQMIAHYTGRPRTVIVDASVDPALLGGVKVSTGEYELDATVRNKLQRLHRKSSLKGVK